MIKLNSLQFSNVLPLEYDIDQTLNPLKNNEIIENKINEFSSKFGFENLKTFKFNKDGFISLMLSLKGKISVSVGESEAIVQAANFLNEKGFEIDLIPLTKEGFVDLSKLSKCDYIFCSSYVMDTYIKTNLDVVKEKTQATIISNISATLSNHGSDIALLDAYKLTGYSLDSIILYNDEFEQSVISEISTISIYQIEKNIKKINYEKNIKDRFLETLNGEFNANIFYFVNPKDTLEYTLHFGLKGIKAREIIRTLALENILVTNGEGCSLGFSKPSRIIQEMTYTESESRWALSLDFSEYLDDETILNVVKKISKKYRQILLLNS
ncbi:cysteine desulfurase [Arcobacter arenosus]|uniref:cysteine desulfurase n=1 Tax=Arcobacter arenosus TaxID=2576037 RepID=UPI003BACDCA6